MTDYSEIIAETDGDLPFGDYVSADINWRKELVIEYVTTDCRAEIESRSLAVVDAEDTAKMAAHLNVPLEQLPKCIWDEYGDPREIWTPSQIKGVFKDVLDYILDCGAKYELR